MLSTGVAERMAKALGATLDLTRRSIPPLPPPPDDASMVQVIIDVSGARQRWKKASWDVMSTEDCQLNPRSLALTALKGFSMEAKGTKAVPVPASVQKKRETMMKLGLAAKAKMAEASKARVAKQIQIIKSIVHHQRMYRAQEHAQISALRQAKQSGGFYALPEAKVAFVIRLRGSATPESCSRHIIFFLKINTLVSTSWIPAAVRFCSSFAFAKSTTECSLSSIRPPPQC